MFKKLLVPIDGSKSANLALKTAVSLAKDNGSSIVILHVLEIGTLSLIEEDPVKAVIGSLSDTMVEISEKGKQILAEARAQLRDVHFEERLELGNPAVVICKAANEESCDLIVLGSRGMGNLEEMLLGSVSHQVLHKCPCPVLLVKDNLRRKQ